MTELLSRDEDTLEYFNQLDTGIVVVNQQMTIIFCNQWVKKRLPSDLQDITNLRVICERYNYSSILPRIEALFIDLQPAILSPVFHKQIIPLLNLDNSKLFMNQQGFVRPLYILRKSDHREELCAMMQIIDVSKMHLQMKELENAMVERELAVAEAKYAKIQAENANQAKSSFLANMSHEIRTPMNAILGFAELLNEGMADEKQQRYLASIMSSGKSLLSLINDILDLSKVEAGKLKIEYSIVNPQQLFQEKQTFFANAVAEKSLTFILDLDSELPEALELDQVRLNQILFNLIGNAIKFTEAGHVKLSAYTQPTAKDGDTVNLVFTVEDTGMGIDKTKQESIFSAFEQQSKQNHAKYGGTGLGLAITKNLVKLMGGTIHLDSEVGKGSRFKVILKDVKVASDKHSKIYPTKSAVSGQIIFESATILIVDDIEINRDLIRAYLGKYDFTLLEAANGEEAVQLVRQHLPDLVLMDMRMPVMDGYAATSQLKNDKSTCDIPVVALTASALKTSEIQIKDLCDGYLRKPIGANELLSELKMFLKYRLEEKSAQPPTATLEGSKEFSREIDFTVPLDAEVIKKLPDLALWLEQKTDEWKIICRALPINGIKRFSNEVQNMGRDFQYPPLQQWGEQLNSQVRRFQLDKLPKTLRQFPEVLKQIKTRTV